MSNLPFHGYPVQHEQNPMKNQPRPIVGQPIPLIGQSIPAYVHQNTQEKPKLTRMPWQQAEPATGIPSFPRQIPQAPFQTPSLVMRQNLANRILSEAYMQFIRQLSSGQTPTFPPWVPPQIREQWIRSGREHLKQMEPKPPQQVARPRGRPRKKSMKDSSGNSSDSNFDNLPDDFVPQNLTERRADIRTNRKTVNYSEAFDEEEEEETPKQIEDAHRLEHIFMSRKSDQTTEYLIRFHDSPQSFCEWVSYNTLSAIPNSSNYISKFQLNPLEWSRTLVTPIAHRRASPIAPIELLYKFQFESTVLFFWDRPSDQTLESYMRARICVPLVDPQYPPPPLPLPDSHLITGDDSPLKDYQVEGLKWLVKCWHSRHGSILADEMGLGKTIQTLAFLTYLHKFAGWRGPFLIAVRTNCFKQWCDEIEKWTHLVYIPYNSGPQQRKTVRDFQFPALDPFGQPIPNQISFNILLVTYDVLLKDTEFLGHFLWEVLVVDEGHRIKNSHGKKNRAMSNLNAKHRIILTGTPIQNSLPEFWTLLKFVSPKSFEIMPTFLEGDIDTLKPDQINFLKTSISQHLMRRSLVDVEKSIAPKEEKVVLLSLTEVQKDLIRLIQLHSVWRLKGRAETGVDTSKESRDILKVCSHPFLVEGAEDFYTKKFQLSRLEMILKVSTKFRWLDNILRCLHKKNRKVLIFSQRVKLLRLLQEYCGLRGYTNELLIGSMTDQEKSSAISRFADEKSSSFIFLISTRAGSEGLNLTIADVTIIFDPDWNPQNDLQAQGRCHRIGQTQKVDVLRLISYRTYENEMFIRAQRKLGLWLSLLGGKQSGEGLIKVPEEPPKEISEEGGEGTLTEIIERMSTVVADFSLPALDKLEEPLKQPMDLGNGVGDSEFIESFPIEKEDTTDRRSKRGKNRDFPLDSESARSVYEHLKNLGYNEWKAIANTQLEQNETQIQRFCTSLCAFAFRTLQPSQVCGFPMLINEILRDIPDFTLDNLLNSGRQKWSTPFYDDHDYSFDAVPCEYLKDELVESSFVFLNILEAKLLVKKWKECRLHSEESNNCDIIETISGECRFDPFSDEVNRITSDIRTFLIKNGAKFFTFPFWSNYEFSLLLNTLKNYPFIPEEPIKFHSESGILSKTTNSVIFFASQLRLLLLDWSKGSIIIPRSLLRLSEAPIAISGTKSASNWAVIPAHDCETLKRRIMILDALRNAVSCSSSESITGIGIAEENTLFKQLIEKGFDRKVSILTDESLPFFSLIPSDQMENIKSGRIENGVDGLPSCFFNEQELLQILDPYVDRSERFHFALPLLSGLSFGSETAKPPKTQKHQWQDSDEEGFEPISKKRQMNLSYSTDSLHF